MKNIQERKPRAQMPLLRRFYFVDLPGYNYAAAAVAIKEKWGRMIER